MFRIEFQGKSLEIFFDIKPYSMPRVGTKKMTIMDFPEILPLCQFESESNEFYGYSYIEVIVFMLSMIVISNIFSHLLY